MLGQAAIFLGMVTTSELLPPVKNSLCRGTRRWQCRRSSYRFTNLGVLDVGGEEGLTFGCHSGEWKEPV